MALNGATKSYRRVTPTCNPYVQSSCCTASLRRTPFASASETNVTAQHGRALANTFQFHFVPASDSVTSSSLWQLGRHLASSCIIGFVGVRTVSRKLSAKCSRAKRRVLFVCESVSHDDRDINILVNVLHVVELVRTWCCHITGSWRSSREHPGTWRRTGHVRSPRFSPRLNHMEPSLHHTRHIHHLIKELHLQYVNDGRHLSLHDHCSSTGSLLHNPYIHHSVSALCLRVGTAMRTLSIVSVATNGT